MYPRSSKVKGYVILRRTAPTESHMAPQLYLHALCFVYFIYVLFFSSVYIYIRPLSVQGRYSRLRSIKNSSDWNGNLVNLTTLRLVSAKFKPLKFYVCVCVPQIVNHSAYNTSVGDAEKTEFLLCHLRAVPY
jgi:hypothetical protein